MTKRDFYVAVANANVSAELTDAAKDYIAKLDATLAARRNKPTKTQIANEPILEQLAALLSDAPQTATVMGEAVGISTQKASSPARCARNRRVLRR